MDRLLAEKTALRRAMRVLREDISPRERTSMAERVETHLLSMARVREARVVLLFWSFGSELRTHHIVAQLHALGQRVLLPFLEGQAMEAAEHGPDGKLVPSGYGPLEPAERVPVDPGEIDLAVAPGLAFDRQGHRLGYGGGHYDRYLARLPRSAHRIGIGFHRQVMLQLPHGPGDERLDRVVTDLETIVCSPSRP